MSNRLIHETSPYLLQHAHNPVDWHPWGDEALERARNENKLLIVSIGYAACHWCHVMEKESFEDAEVADIMNTHFVCIKVDREERPDIDKVYMDAVVLMTQRGGWPLNAVALPDGRPVWGGTYFPKENWISVLMQLVKIQKEDPNRVSQSADQIESAILKMGVVEKTYYDTAPDREVVGPMLDSWMEQIDFNWGGRQVQANKFPLPANNVLLLRAGHFLQHEQAMEAVSITLEKMAFGGIYDHLGGGFSRYSVDVYWKVPHFEKMLYDNGQLISLYAEAFQQNPLPLYRHAVYQSLAFIEREMTSPEGGFYSSLDADSEGEEGKFYVWTYEEIEAVLGADSKLFADYYNVHPSGNWEGNNILFVLETEEAFARRWQLDPAAFQEKMSTGREKLLEARARRIRPGLDDKILASWNALMLKGYADAYRVFGEERFLAAALRNGQFIREKMTDGDRLFRNYKNGKRSIPAFLDDYAFVIEAYIALYQATFDEKWLSYARGHLAHVQAHFFDEKSSMFFYTSDEGQLLINRKIEVQDDVIPSSNASLAHSLHALGLLYGDSAWLALSRQLLDNAFSALQRDPSFHAYWGQMLLKQVFPHYEIAITGEQAHAFRTALDKRYHPGRLFAGAVKTSDLPLLQDRFSDQTTIYVCEGNTCKLPVHTVESAEELMAE